MRSELQLLEGEYWWGGVSEHGVHMPFGRDHYEFDLRIDLAGNQGNPLLISNKGRLVWSDFPFSFQFYSGKLYIEGNHIQIEDGLGDLHETFKYASRRFFPAQDMMPDPLFFSSPQYNTWIEMGYTPTQEKVIRYAKQILDNGFPPGVLMIDDNWNEDYGSWRFHAGRFPDPKAMVDELHELGFKVMLWTCPFISPDSVVFRELQKKRLLLANKNGVPALISWWNGYSAVLDFSKQESVEWYVEQNNLLMHQYGIDGFKLDAGDPEYYKSEEESSFSRNEHCASWARIGLNYRFNEYRACWKQAGQPLVQRLRDKRHSWDHEGLNSLIPNGLALGLMGYAFICPDMIGGGLEGDFSSDNFKLDQELFVRYAQCSALFPMMQFSLAPWKVLDQEHLALCLKTVQIHTQFSDKILRLAEHASITGEPIMRSMAYVYPDEDFEHITDQFMLGDDILVAPVLKKGINSREVIFPEGKWMGDDGEIVTGPSKMTVSAPLSRLPWFRKT